MINMCSKMKKFESGNKTGFGKIRTPVRSVEGSHGVLGVSPSKIVFCVHKIRVLLSFAIPGLLAQSKNCGG